MWPQCDEVTAANSTGKPIASTVAASSDQRVERSERSFVHSERDDARLRDAARRARRGGDAAATAAHAAASPRASAPPP